MSAGVQTEPKTPLVMGVLNLSKLVATNKDIDSRINHSLEIALQMLEDGAAIIDIAYEENDDSKLSIQQEIDIKVPVVEEISKRVSIPIAIDTSNPEVMIAAVEAGASMINDIRALTKLNSLATAAKLNKTVCLMHMYNDPVTKQLQPANNIVAMVYQYLEDRIAACIDAGIEPNKIIIDPGFGFGKNLAQNLNLLRSLGVFKNLNCQILVDVASKSLLGQILDVDTEHREYGAISAEMIAVTKGADIIRSHNVRASVDAIKVLKSILDN